MKLVFDIYAERHFDDSITYEAWPAIMQTAWNKNSNKLLLINNYELDIPPSFSAPTIDDFKSKEVYLLNQSKETLQLEAYLKMETIKKRLQELTPDQENNSINNPTEGTSYDSGAD